MKMPSPYILGGIVLAGILGVGYLQRTRIKRLARKATSAFSDIFSNPEKLGSPDKKNSIANMKPEMARRLKKVKALWEKRGYRGKLRANSGYRTDTHNKKVGGVEKSEHTSGEGIDIAMPSANRSMEFAIQASKSGFKRIGVAKSFVHLGISKKLPQVAWTYPGSGMKKETIRKILNKHYNTG